MTIQELVYNVYRDTDVYKNTEVSELLNISSAQVRIAKSKLARKGLISVEPCGGKVEILKPFREDIVAPEPLKPSMNLNRTNITNSKGDKEMTIESLMANIWLMMLEAFVLGAVVTVIAGLVIREVLKRRNYHDVVVDVVEPESPNWEVNLAKAFNQERLTDWKGVRKGARK